jgi:hypothetical protein
MLLLCGAQIMVRSPTAAFLVKAGRLLDARTGNVFRRRRYRLKAAKSRK